MKLVTYDNGLSFYMTFRGATFKLSGEELIQALRPNLLYLNLITNSEEN